MGNALAGRAIVTAEVTAMRIYQVLVVGSLVALAACKTDDADTAGAPAADSVANDRGEAGRDENGRPVGATDPIVPGPTE
jgi:hypothetical protein